MTSLLLLSDTITLHWSIFPSISTCCTHCQRLFISFCRRSHSLSAVKTINTHLPPLTHISTPIFAFIFYHTIYIEVTFISQTAMGTSHTLVSLLVFQNLSLISVYPVTYFCILIKSFHFIH